MKVNIRFFASIRELAGTKEECLDLEEGSNVRRLLQILCERHGARFTEFLMDRETGMPHSHLQILVNGKSLSSLNGAETRLVDGAEVALMPPVGGG